MLKDNSKEFTRINRIRSDDIYLKINLIFPLITGQFLVRSE